MAAPRTRWLLMAHDRLDGDKLPLTRGFFAMMLGLRRPGVTVARDALERSGPPRGNAFLGAATLLHRPEIAYPLAIWIVGLAIGLRLLLGSLPAGAAFLTIFPAVVLAALLGGLGPSLLAVGLGGAGSWYFLVPPTGSFAIPSPSDALMLVVYAMAAIFSCLLIHWIIQNYVHSARMSQQRDLLLKEVHHRVKNDFQTIASLLAIQQSAVRDPAARRALAEASARVQVLARIHDRLRPSETGVDAGRLLDELCTTTVGAMSGGRTRINVQVPDVRLPEEAVLPIALVAHELVANAIEHGLPSGEGLIEVRLEPFGPNRMRLRVSDDGPGLREGFDPDSSENLGLRIASGLVRQIGGTLAIVPGNGTTFELIFPV